MLLEKTARLRRLSCPAEPVLSALSNAEVSEVEGTGSPLLKKHFTWLLAFPPRAFVYIELYDKFLLAIA